MHEIWHRGYQISPTGICSYDRASGDHTIDVLRRLRAEIPTGKLIVLWDGAPYHRAKTVWAAAAGLDIHLLSLPGYSPDLMAASRCGAGCVRMSPTITAMPRLRI
jgi:transposase